jgi:hypothetical protein
MFIITADNAQELLTKWTAAFGSQGQEIIEEFNPALNKAFDTNNTKAQKRILNNIAFELDVVNSCHQCPKAVRSDFGICPDGADCEINNLKEYNYKAINAIRSRARNIV